MPIAPLIVMLIVSPAGMFAFHMVSYRVMRAARRRPTAHTSAIVAIGVWLVPVLAGVTWLTLPADVDRPLASACSVVYVLAVYGALAVLYVDVVNIAETSLHMRLLLEIAWGDPASLQSLVDRYSPERMVEERLDRLNALGQVKFVDGRYYLGDRSALRLARCIDAWRTVLGLPTAPSVSERR